MSFVINYSTVRIKVGRG